MKKTGFLMSVLLLFVATTACGNKGNQAEINLHDHSKSTRFFQQAASMDAEFATDRQTVENAIALLDSAILYSPEWQDPYWRKHTYLLRLGEYDQALNTLLTAEKGDPDNADLKSLLGMNYLLVDQEGQAHAKLSEAERLWTKALDTISPDNPQQWLHTQINKGAVQKLMGKEEEAEATFNAIRSNPAFQGEEYQGIRDDLDARYLNKSKEEVYEYLLSQIMQNQL